MSLDLRKLARGKACMIRAPGVCNANPETTVLAHYRIIGLSGIGMKSPDWCGAWACFACHDFVDGRSHPAAHASDRREAHLMGVIRTLGELDRMGVLHFMSEAERMHE
jgi:hypothetical protein